MFLRGFFRNLLVFIFYWLGVSGTGERIGYVIWGFEEWECKIFCSIVIKNFKSMVVERLDSVGVFEGGIFCDFSIYISKLFCWENIFRFF